MTATPMMQQYLEIKSRYPDAILFYRLGDFYEMFFEDAVEASKILDLTLTARNKNDPNPVPLCGIPYHSADGYLAKLIEAGRKVVICEQVEDPKQAKGIVRREVTRVVTPGTVTDTQTLDSTKHNFLMGLTFSEGCYQAAVCDISTGTFEFFTVSGRDKLKDEISRLAIREIIYPESQRGLEAFSGLVAPEDGVFAHTTNDLYFDAEFARDQLLRNFRVVSLESLSLHDEHPSLSVLGGLMGYLHEAKLLAPDVLNLPSERRSGDHLFLDETCVSHLELFKSQRDQKRHGTLIWHLDQCQTAMGSRKLAEITRLPLLDVNAIDERLNAVQELLNNSDKLDAVVDLFKSIPDLERLANRFLLGSANPRDAVALKNGLKKADDIKNFLNSCKASLLHDTASEVNAFTELLQKIETTLVDDPPLSSRDGGLIRDGVDAALDELRTIESGGKNTILAIEKRERERTGIASLKIRYNNIFGYYIEITNTHRDKVPSDYIRKQTMTNAERYITDELKDYEAKVLGASERIKAIEAGLFQQLVRDIAAESSGIKRNAAAIGLTDVLQAFASVSKSFRYTRPKMTRESVLNLKGARHPILERLSQGERFVPNDIHLDSQTASEMIITGPNMAGKSTLMRMTALITLMAHMGCFVPCEAAAIGLCDRIFTRVGAHDHLQKGLSTFMVEMVETAKILREATSRSLILLDEIGRGTSTFDGLSIAWAVAEDLHDRLKARTLFATHYHELCDLAEKRKGIKNHHMAVKEWNGEIIFLRKLNAGGTNRSYGVTVAGMAGLPSDVVARAREVLKLLEIKDISFQNELNADASGLAKKSVPAQMTLFDTPESPVIAELKRLNINALTPLDALNTLAKFKEML